MGQSMVRSSWISISETASGRLRSRHRISHLGSNPDPPLPGCATQSREFPSLSLGFFLRAQRPPEGLSPELPPRDLRTLQRMGLEIARGLAHLHSHNYVHRWRLRSHGEHSWGGVCVGGTA